MGRDISYTVSHNLGFVCKSGVEAVHTWENMQITIVITLAKAVVSLLLPNIYSVTLITFLYVLFMFFIHSTLYCYFIYWFMATIQIKEINSYPVNILQGFFVIVLAF